MELLYLKPSLFAVKLVLIKLCNVIRLEKGLEGFKVELLSHQKLRLVEVELVGPLDLPLGLANEPFSLVSRCCEA